MNTSLVGSTTPATSTLQAALKNSSRSAADLPLFPGGVHPLYGLAHGGATDLHGGDCPQILTPLLQSEKGVLLEIRFEQLAGSLVYLGFRAGSLLGRERSALLVQLGVAFDGGEADGKGAGGLALSHPAPERFDDLFPEVF